jgi:hypothetical protein
VAKQKKKNYIFPSVSTDTQNDEARKLWYNKIEGKGWLEDEEMVYIHKEGRRICERTREKGYFHTQKHTAYNFHHTTHNKHCGMVVYIIRITLQHVYPQNLTLISNPSTFI